MKLVLTVNGEQLRETYTSKHDVQALTHQLKRKFEQEINMATFWSIEIHACSKLNCLHHPPRRYRRNFIQKLSK